LLQQAEQSVLRVEQLVAPMLPVLQEQALSVKLVLQLGPVEQPLEQLASLLREAVPVPQEERPLQGREEQRQRAVAAVEQPQPASCALLWRLLLSRPFPPRRFLPRRLQPRPYPGNVCAPLRRRRHRWNSSGSFSL
jgi:hypothetical protein